MKESAIIDDKFGPDSVGIVPAHTFTFAEPPNEMVLESGEKLGPITLAYETYGKLNAQKNNAVLILHALSGDAHVAGYHAATDRKPGWWDFMVGPGKPFDTNKYFMICINVLGGCKGTTGPSSINWATNKPYGLEFPVVTVGDWVESQKRLIDHLGIKKLLNVVGGSVGGMQAIEWTIRFPDRVQTATLIATAARLSAQGIALNEVSRRAIMTDPKWHGGNYYETGEAPDSGLSLARMIAHITYLSEESLHRKFGRKLKDREKYGYNFSTEFQVESYLHYQGDAFIKRFDANSYLYITKTIDYYDMTRGGQITLDAAFKPATAKFMVLSFSSDWLYPSRDSKEIVRALKRNNLEVTYCEINTDYGHDSFLVRNPVMEEMVVNFLAKNLED
jgi:homoserine O-acetyltransferase/O-succinyltransferase